MVKLGHCGGRLIRSELEAEICEILNDLGVAHAHTPRHFEVHLEDGKVAAYSPDIVVRGRGREGKTVVFEAIKNHRDPDIPKVAAFRRQYGQEFYVILVGKEDHLDRVPAESFDEACPREGLQVYLHRMAD